MAQVCPVLGYIDSPQKLGYLLLGGQGSCSGVGEVLSSDLLEDPHNGCQSVGLSRSSGYLVGAGDLIIGGNPSADKHSGTYVDLLAPTVLDTQTWRVIRLVFSWKFPQ